MSAFPHAEKFIEVNQILAKGGAITTLDRATISAFVASLVHEVADKSDALEHFAAENQRLVDVYNHALKKHNEQRGAANDLRGQLASLQQELQAECKKTATFQEAYERLKCAREDTQDERSKIELRRQHASIEAEAHEKLAAERAKVDNLEKENERLQSDVADLNRRLETRLECLTRVRTANARLHEREHDLCLRLDQARSCLQKEHSNTTEDEEVVDDCSPIPKCRQEAAEWAKNTDADGKPLPSKDSDGDECSDGLQLRFFRRGAGGEKVEIDAPDSWGNTDDSEEDEDDESDSDMVADDKIPSPETAETRRRRLGAFDPKDPFGVLRDGIRAPIESAYDDKKEKERALCV